MNTKNKRQYREAARDMEQAMLELMNTMPLKKITVCRICSRAGVNRSTFYAHYSDIYHMIDQMENNLRRELMNEYPVPGMVRPFSVESFLPFLRFIREHKDFYKIALGTRREFPIEQGFEPLWKQVIRPMFEKAGIHSESEMMFYFVGFQASFTMILKRWVDQGCEEREERMAQILHSTVPSVWGIS